MSNENLESKRWLIAIAAVVIQLCLGTVYAWSVFKGPLLEKHGGLTVVDKATKAEIPLNTVYDKSQKFKVENDKITPYDKEKDASYAGKLYYATLETGKKSLFDVAEVDAEKKSDAVKALVAFDKKTMSKKDFPIQLTFMLLMLIIGLAAAFGGTLVDKKGPRFVATIGGLLFGVGTLVSAFADQSGSITLLYIGFGVIAALGNGFGYVTPIATLIRWFPDKRGLVTGLAVMGFGAGAFFMGQIAPRMISSFRVVAFKNNQLVIQNSGVANTFYIWGIIFLVLVMGAAQLFKNPPQGWVPAGFTPAKSTVSIADSFKFGEAVKRPQWWMLWAMLFLNVSAGLGLISQHSTLAEATFKYSNPNITDGKLIGIAAGAVVAYAAIFNGLGRLFWAKLSDNIGRKMVFMIMFATQAVLYVAVGKGLVPAYWPFIVASCYLLACYGGGFATMPAFAADSFGPGYIGKVYGFMLTAWSCAGLVGPFVFSQYADQALYIAAGLLTAGFVIALVFKAPKGKNA
jgi:MFS transporter, OFA family, oxalate/formate antiporter